MVGRFLQLIHTTAQGRGIRPGPSACQRGSITVEAAGAVSILAFITVMLVGMIAVFGAQASLVSAAREAARVAALQSGRAAAEQVVRRVAGQAESRVSSDGEWVTVELRKPVRLPALPGVMRLSARATAYEETPW